MSFIILEMCKVIASIYFFTGRLGLASQMPLDRESVSGIVLKNRRIEIAKSSPTHKCKIF